MPPTSTTSQPIPVPRRPPSTLVSAFLPLMVLGLALLHLGYQLLLWCQRLSALLTQPPASAALPPPPRKVPTHLAVVFAPVPPSTLRLVLSTVLLGPWSSTPSRLPRWTDLHAQRQLAFERKTAADLRSLVRLAAEAGVHTLSVYTATPLGGEVVAALREEWQSERPAAASGLSDPREAQVRSIPLERSRGRYGSAGAEREEQHEHGHEHEHEHGREVEKQGETETHTARQTLYSRSSTSSDSESTKSEDETLASSNTSVAGDALDKPADARPRHSVPLTVELITTGTGRKEKRREHLHVHGASHGESPSGTRGITLQLLSYDDGKLEMARAASECAQRMGGELVRRLAAEPGATVRQGTAWRREAVAGLTVAEVDRLLLDEGQITEPDLLIVVGGRTTVRKLYGFPPWPLRLTELFFDTVSGWSAGGVYSAERWERALERYGAARQRYGK